MMQPTSEPVYFVQSKEDPTTLLAMDIRLDGQDFISWFDTAHERVMGIAKLEDKRPDVLTFERRADEGGGTYTFVPLTLETYATHVKPKLISGKDFTSLEDLYAALRESKKYAW